MTPRSTSFPLGQSQYQMEEKSKAKYIQGTLGMVRSKSLLVPSLRTGQMIINIEDGGSLKFYVSSAVGWNRKNSIGNSTNAGMLSLSSASSLTELHDNNFTTQSVSSFDQGNRRSMTMQPHKSGTHSLDGTNMRSIFLQSKKSRRDIMQVDEKTKTKIDKVSVYVSSSKYEEPIETPYLCIPSNVPWTFKTINKLKNEYIQITVPPLPNGEVDTRVKLMRFTDKIKKSIHFTTVVPENVATFGTIHDTISGGGLDESERLYSNSEYVCDDASSIYASLPDSTMDPKQMKKNTQVFLFKCPNTRDLAVYSKTALILNRLNTENCVKRPGKLFAPAKKRVRTAEGLEIALQTEFLDRNMNRKQMLSKQSSIGSKEYKCLPLYAYPHSWRTDKELLDEMIRESQVWCDLREKDGNEIGCFRIEILQCTGLPKMDAYAKSDPVVYIVCGSSAFVTDVIDNKQDAYWLPLTRRACILPVMNAHAQIYIACFDYDGEKVMDDYIGRVVLDIPQIESGYTYDVQLPLRDCSRVYNRRQLGFIRIRFSLEWNEQSGRAALLSYLPSPIDLKKRMKNEHVAVTVMCPDSKSFSNIAHTVYGKDIPGKYSNNIRASATKELSLLKRMLVFSIKELIGDIFIWKHPLLSGYIFFWWMHFVIANSIALVPSFLLSLLVILLLRNYIKYYVKSSRALLFGHKAISDIFKTLFLKRHSPLRRKHIGVEWKYEDLSCLERLLLRVFGMSKNTIDPQSMWRYENHSEFPFSVGESYPKITHLDLSGYALWNEDYENVENEFDIVDDNDEESTMNDLTKLVSSTSKYVDNVRRQSILSSAEFLKSVSTSTEDASRLSKSLFGRKKVILTDISSKSLSNLLSPPSPIKSSITATSPFPSTKTKGVSFDDEKRSTQSHSGENDKLPLNLPEQNVIAKKGTKKSKPILDEINKVHDKAQRATFRLFDDRVFFVDGNKQDGEKILKLHDGNPVSRKINPVLGGAFKIIDINLNAFRAVFNILMWKDPVLSFWFTILATCAMYILFIFPWRLFFGVVGFTSVGPQNYFLAGWYKKRQAARKERKAELQKEKANSSACQSKAVDLVVSPLLMRNNIQMKPDVKSREIIVPSVPLRYNRFYDWPPDPSTTVIMKRISKDRE